MNIQEAIPQDLRDFIVAGSTLDYDVDNCEVGRVTLCTIEQLQLSLFSVGCDDTDVEEEDPNVDGTGCNLVEGVDLVRETDGGYDSSGV